MYNCGPLIIDIYVILNIIVKLVSGVQYGDATSLYIVTLSTTVATICCNANIDFIPPCCPFNFHDLFIP